MKSLQILALRTALLLAVSAFTVAPAKARAASAAQIDAASRAALRQLYASNGAARAVRVVPGPLQ